MNMETPSFRLPSFHLNGNSPKALGGEYLQALNTLNEFREKFAAVEFHPRDYYTISDEAFNEARSHRRAVLDHINAIDSYLQAHVAHCFASVK